MKRQPYEVRATRPLHSHLLIASHAALEQAVEATRRPAHPDLEARYWSTLGHIVNWNLHCELEARLGGSVQWFSDRGFLAMVPRGLDIAIRLGRCDPQGHPIDTDDREEDTPYGKFLRDIPLLFKDSELRPVFGGYSRHRFPRDGDVQVEVDRFVLAKYREEKHVWSWGLDPADPGRVRSVLDGRAVGLEIVPTFIPIERQRNFA